ncbi:retrotransposon-like protein 1 [Plakobranchus ocellatus]|uniref:Retrotransposon-like protein 1 n=1 Tax=Plakobranchus ocellatus TaxID=259542 RepID=A0AAV4B3G3_9GAST|nr:retrotransposon-like protein 1 [Plakobranchus ocellatus]
MSARASGSPESAPLQNRPRPAKPWSRLHIDFEGSYLDNCWLELCVINKTTAGETISLLHQNVFNVRNRDSFVLDKGAAFTSSEFHQFMENNEIGDIHCAP